MTFPKQITIRLPELQLVALNALLRRADGSPSELLEHVVALGICQQLARCSDEAADVGADDGGEPVGEIPPTTSLHLEHDLRARLARAMTGRAGLSLETFMLRLLEWGLDAYDDDLEIVESERTDQARS